VLFQKISILPSRKVFFGLNPHPSGNSSLDSYFPLKVLAFKIPPPLLGISNDPLWWGLGYFLEPHNVSLGMTSMNTHSCKKKFPLLSKAFKQLKESNPDGQFWIKVDAFDIKAALQEFVKGVWNGDVDMGDGKLELRRLDYERRKSLCKGNDLKADGAFLELRLKQVIDALQEDVKFLSDGLATSYFVQESGTP